MLLFHAYKRQTIIVCIFGDCGDTSSQYVWSELPETQLTSIKTDIVDIYEHPEKLVSRLKMVSIVSI